MGYRISGENIYGDVIFRYRVRKMKSLPGVKLVGSQRVKRREKK